MLNLKNKNILITGAGGLLGSQFTKTLLENGAVCHAIDFDKRKLEKLQSFISKKYRTKLKTYNIDITNQNQLIELNDYLKKNCFIEVLINNAANNFSLNQKEENIWEDDINLNLTSVKNIIDLFSKTMIQKKRGNIINIGSDLSIIAPDQRIYKDIKGYKKPLSYSVTKHGLVGMTKYYASLLAKDNIRVNCLCPGGIFNQQNRKFVNRLKKLIPLNRMANHNEYNGAILFLSSDATNYMTGQNLIIDGGRTIL